MAISSGLSSSVLLPAGLGFRNLIMNGDMRVDQRGTATTAVTTNAYTVDRWYVEDGSDAVLSAQQSTDVPTGEGFSKSLKVTATTADASIGATKFAVITQHIEGSNSAQLAWGASGAKPVVVSFWVKATVTGTYSFTLYSDSATRICPSSYTVNASNTWEKKTVYIVGDSSGTWLTTTGRGVICNFYIALGTNYLGTSGVWNSSSIYGVTGQANALASTNNIFAITGVPLEQTYQPTPFEQRPIGVELALCQRYYLRKTATKPYSTFGFGQFGGTTTTARAAIPLNVPMRVNPTAIDYGGTLNINQHYVQNFTATSIILNPNDGNHTMTAEIGMTIPSAGPTAGTYGVFGAGNDSSAYVGFSAEL
jgi:hypothetical protein